MISRENILPEIFVKAYYAFAKELIAHEVNGDWRPVVEIVQHHRTIFRNLARADINTRRRALTI